MEIGLARIEFSRLGIHQKNSSGRMTFMSFAVRDGYPRFSVVVNGDDKTLTGINNMIIAPFDIKGFATFLNIFKSIVKAPGNAKLSIECLNLRWVNKVKTDEKYVQAKITVGKDSEGIMYISFSNEVFTDITLKLEPGEWFNFYDEDNKPINKAVLSKLYTLSYIEMLERINAYLITEYSITNNTAKLDEVKKD